ncbi:HK97 gp10 family phage protein [Acrocarpospora sp. B8E8]|uniref:HK97 gp10 family phage protein n=1 Tax=Acrocarpospora sp. B8E8 TaxID=3153572 RepID=UPI00325F8218
MAGAKRAKFRGNYKGIGQILASPQMQRAMEARAERVKQRAISGSPVETGDYKQSFKVEGSIRKGKTTRAIAKVINDSPHAAYVEWGTSKTPRYRVMGKAAGAE